MNSIDMGLAVRGMLPGHSGPPASEVRERLRVAEEWLLKTLRDLKRPWSLSELPDNQGIYREDVRRAVWSLKDQGLVDLTSDWKVILAPTQEKQGE